MADEIRRRGLMLVLSSPSGAGKTTLSKRLLAADGNLFMSISATTRPMRKGEVEARDYYFVSTDTFAGMVGRGEFFEHATVFGNSYGTPMKPVMDALHEGRDVLFDIDWQGAQQMKEKARDDLVSVFILPPSHAELERRLQTRAQDSADIVRQRMQKAANEISHWPEYDYVIVNRDVDVAHAQIKAVLDAERVRRTRQIGLSDFVGALTN